MSVALPRPMQELSSTLLPVGRELAVQAMVERGLTVSALALQLGLSRKHLSNVLHGHVPLTQTLAEQIAQALGLEEQELADLRHDGVTVAPLASIPPMPIRVLADPTEPVEDWAEP